MVEWTARYGEAKQKREGEDLTEQNWTGQRPACRLIWSGVWSLRSGGSTVNSEMPAFCSHPLHTHPQQHAGAVTVQVFY
jgi:hypothetical protein